MCGINPICSVVKTAICLPQAFLAYNKGKHAVDDNNATRQAKLNVTTAWTAKEPIKRHVLFYLALCESNALEFWNYLHPTKTMSKIEWRMELTGKLFRLREMARLASNFADAEPSDEHEKMKFPDFSKWDINQGRFVKALSTKAVRNVCVQWHFLHRTSYLRKSEYDQHAVCPHCGPGSKALPRDCRCGVHKEIFVLLQMQSLRCIVSSPL